MLYLASAEEMAKRFENLCPPAIENTMEIFEKIKLEIKTGDMVFPKAKIPQSETEEDYLVKKAKEGLEKRIRELEEKGELFIPKKEYYKRLEEELEVIIEKGYAGYFLVLADFINFAKSREIAVSPGRGNIPGSLVAYTLYITEIDPLKFGLFFEKFLNKETQSFPDIDMDFPMERRDEVIKYVTQKYGKDYVAKISAFKRLKPREIITKVSEVLELDKKEVYKILKKIKPGESFSQALSREEVRRLVEKDKEIRELFKIAVKLEELVSGVSKHPAGLIISSKPIVEIAPLMQDEEGNILTQFDVKSCKEVGLIKFDFLGLKELTIIENTLKLIKKHEGITLNLNKISLLDKKTFELLAKADTNGIFQLDSPEIKELLKRLKPSYFKDIVALIALYRPMPLEKGLFELYINAKSEKVNVNHPHPLLKKVLEETYGIILYKEQIIEIIQKFGGYDFEKAEFLRKVLARREKFLCEKLKQEFINSATKRGFSKEIAEYVFSLLENYAPYGFSKTHSVAYAFISYQMAYLKAHYPLYFNIALNLCQNLNACQNEKEVFQNGYLYSTNSCRF